MKQFTVLTLIAVFMILILCGCGGDGATNISPSTADTGTGSLELKVDWDEIDALVSSLNNNTMTGQIIPSTTHHIKITLYTPATPSLVGDPNTPVNYPAAILPSYPNPNGISTINPVTIARPESSITINNIPCGRLMMRFEAQDSSNKNLATRIRFITILVSQTVPVTANLGVTIENGKFDPNEIVVSAGDTLTFGNYTFLYDYYITFTINGVAESLYVPHMHNGAPAMGKFVSYVIPSTAETQVPVYLRTGSADGPIVDTGNIKIHSSGGGPELSNINPNSGPVGTTVTITGNNFGSTQGSSTVTFNGTPVTSYTSWIDTEIQCAVPTGTTTGNVVVTVNSQNSNGVIFTVSNVDSRMVSIPGGTFSMGTNVLLSSEEPVHSINVSSFNMFKYEVTNSDYILFLNSQGNQTEGGIEWINTTTNIYQGIAGGPNPGTFTIVSSYEKFENRPVVYVSWYGAVAYCNWLSIQEGLTPCYGPINNRGNDPSVWRNLNGYRLPTEAEWEYACRGGQSAEYYWGDPYPPDPPNIGNYAWYTVNSVKQHAVGQKLPNGFGLYDMSGNVWEWCSDWFGCSYYAISPGTNPTGPATGVARVFRGGDWSCSPRYCLSAYRGNAAPDDPCNGSVGFRPVRNAP